MRLPVCRANPSASSREVNVLPLPAAPNIAILSAALSGCGLWKAVMGVVLGFGVEGRKIPGRSRGLVVLHQPLNANLPGSVFLKRASFPFRFISLSMAE